MSLYRRVHTAEMVNTELASTPIDTEEECAICFEELTNVQDDIYILDCEHRFHSKCLNSWYNRPGCNFKCPSCNVQREIVDIKYSIKELCDEETAVNGKKRCFRCTVS